MMMFMIFIQSVFYSVLDGLSVIETSYENDYNILLQRDI